MNMGEGMWIRDPNLKAADPEPGPGDADPDLDPDGLQILVVVIWTRILCG